MEFFKHILLLSGGLALFFLSDWNIKKDQQLERRTFTSSYWMKFLLAGGIVFIAITYIAKDILNFFGLIN